MLRSPVTLGLGSVLRLRQGADLLEELERHVAEAGITLAWVWGLGAVSRATLLCYDQERHAYDEFSLDRPLEVASLTGNVSLREGRPFIHAHLTLSDECGAAYGGHLTYGTTVFAFEGLLLPLAGATLDRLFDEGTGLALWPPASGPKNP